MISNIKDYMTRRFLLYMFSMAMLFLLTQCRSNEEGLNNEQHDFLMKSELGVYQNNADILVFDKIECQMTVSSDGRLFRINKDNFSAMAEFVFSENPASCKADSVEGSVDFTGLKNDDVSNCTFKVLKSTGDKCWLWNESNKIGVITMIY